MIKLNRIFRNKELNKFKIYINEYKVDKDLMIGNLLFKMLQKIKVKD